MEFFQLFHFQGGYFLIVYVFCYEDFVHREAVSLMQGASGILKKSDGIFGGIFKKTVQVCHLLAEI